MAKNSNIPTNDDLTELGVPVTQRGQPNLRDHVPKRFIPLAEAQAKGWSRYYDGGACRFGHQASRAVANPAECSDCVRVRAGKDPIYPKSRAQEFRSATKPTNAEKAAAPVIVAPPAPPEPSAADQKFLAKLDELRDFDVAAKAAGTTRGLIEARASSNPVFRAALDDLCERRQIPRTRAPDAAFKWTLEIERQLVRRFVDTGLIAQSRDELGVSASDYQAHLRDSSDFASAISEAMPMARETLRERAVQAAAVGNDKLAKLIEEEQGSVFIDVMGRRHAYLDPNGAREELTKLLASARKKLAQRQALERIAVERGASNTDLTQ